ncbi:putative ribonuclease H-like domain-containing protein, partial [Tanacetum coccineum]
FLFNRIQFDPTNSDQDNSEIPALEDIYQNPTDGIFTNSSYDDEGAVADFTNLETVVTVSTIPTSRITSIYPSTLILGDPQSAVQTRSKVSKSFGAYAFVSYIQKQRRNNHKDFQHFQDSESLDSCKFALWEEGNWNKNGFIEIRRMREELWIEAIRIFLAFASYMGFIVYQMDVKSVFLYGKIDEEHGYRRGTIDKTLFIKKDKHDIILVQVYVDDIIFGSTKKSWCDKFEALMKGRFQMSSMGELTFFLGLQVKQKADGIFISQDKYVAEILKKFDFVNVKTASTPIETQKPLVKDEEASDVDVHLYRSMIGSLMYLTASRPDIMFAVCACSRFQVTPKTSHLSAVKRIFRYLKGKPKLGLWYPRVSLFDLEAYSDSDYAGANLDRKSTTGGCQFLGRRLISWQCKKQTIVATSTTEAEYVAAASCCGQVLWIQNQMLDYGFNFMNTKIYIDNESTICIVKNPIYHSKRKHIAIRHHFMRDAYEKKLIQVLKIHTDDNVADFLTKAFDVSRESLRRVLDGTEALMLPTLFILWLATVSTDSAELVPLGKVSTAIETLKKNIAKGIKILEGRKFVKDVGRTRDIVGEEKENDEIILSTEDVLSTKKEKRERKKKIEEEDESESESDGIPEAEKKFKQLESDEEMARKIQEGVEKHVWKLKHSELKIRSFQQEITSSVWKDNRGSFLSKNENECLGIKLIGMGKAEIRGDKSKCSYGMKELGRSKANELKLSIRLATGFMVHQIRYWLLLRTEDKVAAEDGIMVFIDGDENGSKALLAMKAAKPKEKMVVQESSEKCFTPPTMVSTATTSVVSTPAITILHSKRDKRQGIMIYPGKKPISKKNDQIELDEVDHMRDEAARASRVR